MGICFRWCPKPYRREVIRKSGNVDIRFGGECSCTGNDCNLGDYWQMQQVYL